MTGIQWTDETWNPTIGCRRVSEGCRHCYAERQAKRIVAMSRGRGQHSPYEDVVKMDDDGEPTPRWNGRAVLLPERLVQPLRWTKPRRIFVDSMSDLFHESLDFFEIAAVWGVMAACPQHTFQVLTKRPERVLEFFAWLDGAVDGSGEDHLTAVLAHAQFDFSTDEMRWREDIWSDSIHPVRGEQWPLHNVWLGVSCEDQAAADERIPWLMKCPAAVRFVSAEPLLGPIDFQRIELRSVEERVEHEDEDDTKEWLENLGPVTQCALTGEVSGAGRPDGDDDEKYTLDWVIVGGESGPGARPCDVGWVKSIVDQCKSAGVPVFVKQLGKNPVEENPIHRDIDPDPYIEFYLEDRKGGDPDEWPEDLRVRQWPEGVSE